MFVAAKIVPQVSISQAVVLLEDLRAAAPLVALVHRHLKAVESESRSLRQIRVAILGPISSDDCLTSKMVIFSVDSDEIHVPLVVVQFIFRLHAPVGRLVLLHGIMLSISRILIPATLLSMRIPNMVHLISCLCKAIT